MKYMVYQQSRTITAERSRNKSIGINRTDCKTDYVYVTEIPSSEGIEIIEQALVYFEEAEGFTALNVSYLADNVSDKWTVKFTIEGRREDLSRLALDYEIDTDFFEEREDNKYERDVY